MRQVVPALLFLALVGCAPAEETPERADPATTSSSDVATTSSAPEASAPALTEQAPFPPNRRRPATLRGIDVSHHQGAIDWRAVAGAGTTFAYLKATEGSGFNDDRFTANWAAAKRAGLDVGGYHYFTLCGAPEPQADHYVDRLEEVDYGRRDLPPVVDLELIGNCDPTPERPRMLASVRSFIERVERATGRDVVVYFHPDFERRYHLVDELDRRLWVRSVGERPAGDWFIWQRDDAGSVAGIDGPVDVDVMRR